MSDRRGRAARAVLTVGVALAMGATALLSGCSGCSADTPGEAPTIRSVEVDGTEGEVSTPEEEQEETEETDEGEDVERMASFVASITDSYHYDDEGWAKLLSDAEAQGVTLDEESVGFIFRDGQKLASEGRGRALIVSKTMKHYCDDLGGGDYQIQVNVRSTMSPATGDPTDDTVRANAIEEISPESANRYGALVVYSMHVNEDGTATVSCSNPEWYY